MPDIAKRRAATAVFDGTGRFFRLSHELLATTTPDGTFRRLNRGWSDQLGYKKSALTDHPLVEFVHPGEVEHTLTELAKLSAGTTNVTFENNFRASDGSYRWLRWTADLAGGVVYAVARDVTTQRMRVLSVANEQAYSLGLAETSARGFVTMDSELSISDVNEAMCAMLGRNREEIVGSSFGEHVFEHEHAVAGIRLAIAEGIVSGYELTLRGLRGSPVPASCNFGVFRDADGEVVGVLAGVRDEAGGQRQTERRAHHGVIIGNQQPLTSAAVERLHALRAALAEDGPQRMRSPTHRPRVACA